MIKLYRHELSGHAHRVELFLSLLGLDHELVDVDLVNGEHKQEAFRALNPFGQVPVIDDDGTIVSDSNAILVYLAKKYGTATWLPEDAEGAARVTRWLSSAAGPVAFGPATARLITIFGAPLDAERAKTIAYLEALKPYPIAWIEEPVHPLDFDLHRDIAAHTAIPLATGENLFSCDDARNLIRHGGLRRDRDLLQFDISLSYGIVEYLRILDDLDAQGWKRERCAPHAGHLLAMHAVGGLGLGLAEVAMDTSTLFGKLTAHVLVSDGAVTLPDTPGAGFEQLPMFSEIFGGLLN